MKPFLMTVIVLSGLSAIGSVYAKTLSFSENQTLPVALSSTNINRIVVPNDQINNVVCPTGFCLSKHNANDQSGSAYIQVLTQNQFTLYLSTASGHQVSLAITPTKSEGNTLVLTPASANTKAQAWETASSYRTTLLTLVRNMINGTTPDGYGFTTINHADAQKVFKGSGTLTMQALWSGNYLNGVSYIFKNLTSTTLTLPESAFYHPGVRLVATTEQKVNPGESEIVYEILSKNTN